MKAMSGAVGMWGGGEKRIVLDRVLLLHFLHLAKDKSPLCPFLWKWAPINYPNKCKKCWGQGKKHNSQPQHISLRGKHGACVPALWVWAGAP